MKYSTSLIITRPRAEVVAKFEDPDLMKHWQKGFISMTPTSTPPGVKGATSLLVYQMGKRRMEMVETIETSRLPDEFTAIFEVKGVWNRNENHFSETADNHTEWVQVNEFRFGGFVKLLSWIMPGMFRKQSAKTMNDFKVFVERSAG